MKNILILLVSIFSVSCYSQTQIPGTRLVPGSVGTEQLAPNAVTPEKLSSTALRPTSGGVLSNYELVFDQPKKTYTLDVDEDISLTLAGSGNVAHSEILILATGDGSHVLSFPASWKITGTYDPDMVQEVFLRYNGSFVIGQITHGVDATEAELNTAIVTGLTPDQLNLTFSEAVNIDANGWTVTASGGQVTIFNVTGSGTTAPVFVLSRAILHTETVSVSYAPSSGATTDLSGNEIETITNLSVTVPDPPDPEPEYDITVDDSGGEDHTTIQAAVNAATSGQTIGVREGTYRETVVAKSGVTIEAFPGEDAYISGFEVIPNTGWTVHSGNIYKKTITLPVNGFNTSTSRVAENSLNTTIFANQILRNGVMMHEARWPNIAVAGTYGTDDLFDRTKYRQLKWDAGFNVNNVVDATLPIAAPGLIGATIVSNGWFMQEPRTITGHSGNTINFANIWDNNPTGVWSRQRYYLTGKLALLNAEGEWHYESGTLYFWQPGGGTPSGTIVYKARNWGIDARGKTDVKIIRMKFIGCEPFVGNEQSTNALLDGIESTFQNHHVRHDVWEWQGVGMSKQFGIKLIGANSTIKNSILHYGGSSGVWLGEGCRAENNLMHDIGYVGYWANPVSFWGTADNIVVTRNTIYRTGRSSIDFGYNFGNAPGSNAKHYNVEVSYNDMSQWGLISKDVGATYTWGQKDLFGLDYHHNWIHDIGAPSVPNQDGVLAGIYFDQATGPGRIHHNVVWNAGETDVYHETTNEYRMGQTTWTHPDTRLDIYNNTFLSSSTTPTSYRSYVSSPVDVQRNNIYGKPISVGAYLGGNNGNTSNSILSTTNPLLVGGDINNPAAYFQLQSGSPARGIGLGSFTGATGVIDSDTDAGAYQFGGEAWVPGYVEPVDDGRVNDDDPGFTYSAGWNHYTKSGFEENDYHVTTIVGASASYTFNETNVEVFYETCENMGVALIEVLNASNVVIESEEVDMYVDSGGAADDLCTAGAVDSFSFESLPAGNKTVRFTLHEVNSGTTPARSFAVFDGIRVYD